VAVTPGAVAVILLPDSNRVLVADVRGKVPVALVPAANPVGVALSADGELAFVAAAGRGGSGELVKIATQDGTVLRRATIAGGRSAVYVWPGRRDSRMHWLARP
jgi:DNA-binding beta-propeller fold protein YncE